MGIFKREFPVHAVRINGGVTECRRSPGELAGCEFVSSGDAAGLSRVTCLDCRAALGMRLPWKDA